MTLEQAFYIIGIVTMSLMLVLMLSLVITVFVIKSKISHLHRMVEEKIQVVSVITETAKGFFSNLAKGRKT